MDDSLRWKKGCKQHVHFRVTGIKTFGSGISRPDFFVTSREWELRIVYSNSVWWSFISLHVCTWIRKFDGLFS